MRIKVVANAREVISIMFRCPICERFECLEISRTNEKYVYECLKCNNTLDLTWAKEIPQNESI